MPLSNARLVPHPASPDSGVRRIAVTAGFADAGRALEIRYRLEGAFDRVRFPSQAGALRADGLWQHTALEAFLRADASGSYYEFNFSPSGAWAAYRFSARREGRESPDLPAPRIGFSAGERACEMKASIAVAGLSGLADASVVHAGLAAVIEDTDGRLAHWALAHRAAEPDFHDPATFTLPVRR
jgi:hypothetical protein